MIEGILRYLDRREGFYLRLSRDRAYFIAIMLRHPWESYIKRDTEISKRIFYMGHTQKLLRHETKYYFDLARRPGGMPLEEYKLWVSNRILTFTKVWNKITVGEVDTLGGWQGLKLDNRRIEIKDYTVSKHTHLGRFPEIYPNDYRVI